MPRKYLPLTLVSGVALLALIAGACGDGEPASLEERAQSIDRSLMCPVCPGETIDQAQVELAYQMRALVREKLGEGWDRQRVLRFFADRYGEDVLASPPKSGANLVAWIVPPVGVAGGAIVLLLVLRSMWRSDRGREESDLPPEGELQPYLSAVDRELGFHHEDPEETERRG